jgi:ribosomal protein L21E
LDVIKTLTIYNNSVHSAIGTPASKGKPSNIYFVWQKMNSLRTKVPQECVKFKVGDLVRIAKKGKVCKGVRTKLFNGNISGSQGY